MAYDSSGLPTFGPEYTKSLWANPGQYYRNPPSPSVASRCQQMANANIIFRDFVLQFCQSIEANKQQWPDYEKNPNAEEFRKQQYWATKKLYIKDFPKEQKEEELIEEMKDVFSAFGTIVNIKLIKDKPADSKDANAVGSLKGFGFIEFDDEDPVDKCNSYPQDKSMGRGNYYYDYEMYPYEYYQPGPYGGGQRPNFRYQGRGDYQGYGGYDFYPRGNYSRGGGGGGGRPYRGGSGRNPKAA
ncbi:hypothetical protein MAR_035076 [Mya arenaria]|uniref:RRM domain-containing protein n=1 Tax=Mya arenaria TaxID=6604 RepID=A0ABY7ELC2_MYAAR|nr:hypothetical protein MAR_035076 [Mya arenaria]